MVWSLFCPSFTHRHQTAHFAGGRAARSNTKPSNTPAQAATRGEQPKLCAKHECELEPRYHNDDPDQIYTQMDNIWLCASSVCSVWCVLWTPSDNLRSLYIYQLCYCVMTCVHIDKINNAHMLYCFNVLLEHGTVHGRALCMHVFRTICMCIHTYI